MSEFYTQVVVIEKVEKHPKADRLDICTVLSGYPVISKRDEFKVGDRAVYLSVDSLVPLDDERWSFLRKDNWQGKYHKIRAARIRKIFSMGILTVANPEWEVGFNVAKVLGIKKWEPEVDVHMQTESEANLLGIPTYTDIDGLRKNPRFFEEGEQVVITEKVHGSNYRAMHDGERLWVGSHHQIKKNVEGSVWWEVAKKYQLDTVLKQFPNMVFFGEVFGYKIQDLTYGCKPGEQKLGIFDIWDKEQCRYLDWETVMEFTHLAGLNTVPLLYVGPWSNNLVWMSEGQSTCFGSNHVREGIVVKTLKEQVNHRGMRCIMKLHGEAYLTRKEK